MSSLSFLWDEAPWMAEGLCGQVDPEIFFPEDGVSKLIGWSNDNLPGRVLQAKALCESCPVMDECREYGLDEEYGIWGGLTSTERRKLGRGQGRVTLPPATSPSTELPPILDGSIPVTLTSHSSQFSPKSQLVQEAV